MSRSAGSRARAGELDVKPDASRPWTSLLIFVYEWLPAVFVVDVSVTPLPPRVCPARGCHPPFDSPRRLVPLPRSHRRLPCFGSRWSGREPLADARSRTWVRRGSDVRPPWIRLSVRSSDGRVYAGCTRRAVLILHCGPSRSAGLPAVFIRADARQGIEYPTRPYRD